MDAVAQIKDALATTLNGNILSPDSIYGVVILIIIAYLIYRGIRKAVSSVGSILGFILLWEILHVAAFNTPVGLEWFPVLQTVFKFDVFTALAQLCVGTPVSDFLLYAQAWIIAVVQRCVEVLGYFFGAAIDYLRQFS